MSTPAIRVDDLHFAYPGAPPALAGVSFRVDAGERVAILGANGAGKSTLILHLNGLLLPDRGGVTVFGEPVVRDSLRKVRRRVGMVFQQADDQLFLPSLLEDVAFGPLNQGRSPDEAEADARAILGDLGLHVDVHRAAHHLSGGEQRLAALATVLVSRPDILVLDEPSAGLDAGARRRVVDILRSRTETLMVATHDLDVAAATCDHALVMGGGRLVYDGPLREALADTDLLRTHGLYDPLPPIHERR